MRIALYQPDIPQNTGAMLRLSACFGTPVHIIEPCGFVMDDSRLRRAGLDYVASTPPIQHVSWNAFLSYIGSCSEKSRLVLLTTHAERSYIDECFTKNDILLLGRETAGVPEEVHAAVESRIKIPIGPGMRSLNVVTAAAIVLSEALRQTDAFPK